VLLIEAAVSVIFGSRCVGRQQTTC